MATTGRGRWPLRSEWMRVPMQLRSPGLYADDGAAATAVWVDWFFDAPPAPPSAAPQRMMTGMGT